LKESKSSSIGINAPIVSTKLEKSDQKKDYSDYLVPRGTADIFFPTNFRLIKLMHDEITKKDGEFMKTHQFVEEYSHTKWATTKSGYNPLKEDFLNTVFFLTKL